MPREAEDLTGRVYGSRTVVSRARDRRYGRYNAIYWEVECTSCGARSEVQGSSLRRGVGCPCGSKAPPRAGPAIVKLKRKKPPGPAPPSQVVLTWGVLKRKLEGVPDNLPLQVNLVGEQGWAVRAIRGVTCTGQVIVLGAELPVEIQRHPEKV